MAALRQVGVLGRRSIVRTLRQPPLVINGIVFPLFLYAFNVGGLAFATKIPGFPVRSFATFGLGLTFAYCGIYAATVAGTQLGEDMRTGFVKRMSLTPLRSGTILVGQLGGVVALSFVQALTFIAAGLVAGAHFKAGPGGAALIVAMSGLYAIAMGSIGLMLALHSGSPEAVQGLFPILMLTLFVSSVNLPRDLIRAGWFKSVATFNPISYLVEAPRSLLVDGWQAKPLLLGVLVAAGIMTTALINTSSALRRGSVRR